MEDITHLQGIIVRLENKIVELEKSNSLLRLTSIAPSTNQPSVSGLCESNPVHEYRISQLENRLQNFEMQTQLSRLEDRLEKRMVNIEDQVSKQAGLYNPHTTRTLPSMPPVSPHLYQMPHPVFNHPLMMHIPLTYKTR